MLLCRCGSDGVLRQAGGAYLCNGGRGGDSNGRDIGNVGCLCIVGVAMLSLLVLLTLAFATLTALVRLISSLLALLVTLLLIREVGVTTLLLDRGELVGLLLVIATFATSGFSFILCKQGSAHIRDVEVSQVIGLSNDGDKHFPFLG